MTAEEKREQLLKRILPALAITIIYFVFVSDFFSKDMQKAKQEHETLMRGGASESAMQGALSQQNQVQQRLSKLRNEIKISQAKLDEFAGFLASNNTSNTSTALLSNILANHKIKVQKEERENFVEDNLTAALKEVWQALKPVESKNKKAPKKSKKDEKPIYVQHLWLKGSYLNMYQALDTIAESELKALPVALSMQTADDSSAYDNELIWEFILWM